MWNTLYLGCFFIAINNEFYRKKHLLQNHKLCTYCVQFAYKCNGEQGSLRNLQTWYMRTANRFERSHLYMWCSIRKMNNFSLLWMMILKCCLLIRKMLLSIPDSFPLLGVFDKINFLYSEFYILTHCKRFAYNFYRFC